jgi:hypothetical protein
LLGEFGDSEGDTNSGGTEGQSSGGTEGQSSAGDTQGQGSGDTEGQGSGGSSTTGEPGVVPCDPWQQDCPAGQKCAPYTSTPGLLFDAFRCVDVHPVPQPAWAPCHITGAYESGEDDCEPGAVCWEADPVTFAGTCLPMCNLESWDEPLCDTPGTHCEAQGDSLALCLVDCDPLAQNCEPDEVCVPNPADLVSFLCAIDVSGEEGQALDPCGYANACDPGLACMLQPAVECALFEFGCCTPLCDVSQPNTCPGAGQACVPWFEEGEALPGEENIGICTLPP